MEDIAFDLPSAGPDALPFETALAGVLGYARGRRPLRFRSPSHPDGRWVQVLAFGYERFDRQASPPGPPGDRDVLIAEGLHGRLDRVSWTAVRAALDHLHPLVRSLAERAAGRPFWALPADEFSVLDEPGTVGALLRELGGTAHAEFVLAAFHHRWPSLVPQLSPTTRRQLWLHVQEGDSGVEAVVHRELRANADAFAALETAVAGLLEVPLTRLRLHDILLWLCAGLRLAHAVALGRATAEWQRYAALTPAVS